MNKQYRIIVLFFLIVVNSTTIAADADFSQIKQLIRQHDYKNAHALLVPLAEANNSEAQLCLLYTSDAADE